ncbi:ABC transporter permease [Streptomyces sp. XD-27]|uniref:ABC transporter permease n=1 Tax=Streptomyces sp. XD-27 TaxID=3062779 RepID=UPI0026F41F62|nr:ABC transporter permease [Streptomyces sp. XD-27]WKX72739.1 ABC transporter permease [Streptomyces sp. XD-27]
MLVYIIRRLVTVVVMLLVVTLATFGVFFMVPKLTGTDPALMYVGKNSDKASVEGTRKKLGLDEPVLVQYGEFVKGLATGRDYDDGVEVTHCPAPCFGYSFKTEQEVWPILKDRLPVTASLASGAAALWLVGGVGVGIVSALKRGTIWDRAAMVGALAGVSLPIYFTGLLSLSIFSYQLGWTSAEYVPFMDDPGGWFTNLMLPWITLAFLYAAMYARLTRATMLEVMGEDYIRTARAKGLKESTVVRKHALRSTMTPILTIFGLDLGALVGGAVLTEKTYNLRGLGYEAVNAIQNKDLPVILGVTLVAAFFVVIANLVVDLLYAVIDPRVRLS